MSQIHDKTKDYIAENWIDRLARETGLCNSTLRKIAKGQKNFSCITLSVLYKFFNIDRDSFYKKNLAKGLKPSKGLIWDLFRVKRLEQGLSIKEVAKTLRCNKRDLIRIELWNSLPWQNSYYTKKLLNLYSFTEEEKSKIKYCISLQKDLVKVVYKYDKDIWYYFDK